MWYSIFMSFIPPSIFDVVLHSMVFAGNPSKCCHDILRRLSLDVGSMKESCHNKERSKKFQSSWVRGVEIEDFIHEIGPTESAYVPHHSPTPSSSAEQQPRSACKSLNSSHCIFVSTRSQFLDFLRLLDCFFHIPTRSSICLGHFSDYGSSFTNHHPHLLLGRYN